MVHLVDSAAGSAFRNNQRHVFKKGLVIVTSKIVKTITYSLIRLAVGSQKVLNEYARQSVLIKYQIMVIKIIHVNNFNVLNMG